MRRPLLDLTDDLAFTQNIYTDVETIEKVLKVVQQLAPAGVGARDLQECLLIQLQRKAQTPQTELASLIVEKTFEKFKVVARKKAYQNRSSLKWENKQKGEIT